MKLLILCLLVTSLACSNAWVKYRPHKLCVDCYGRRVWPGMHYYDGCNWCRCSKYGTASCTYRMCKFNNCFKKRG